MLSARLRRLLLPLLRAAAKGGPVTFRMRSAAQQALFLVGKATSKSKGGRLWRIKPPGMTTKEIRAAVFKRAGDYCEVIEDGISKCPHRAWHMDHWLGGSGRRREKQSVETCWAMCRYHHDQRTGNRPSAAIWNERFRIHSVSHGYPPIAHITHAQLKRSAP